MARPKRRATPMTLVALDPGAQLKARIDHLDEAARERIVALVPFVAGLRAAFARQWPARGVDQGRPGHFTRTWPFPECWPLHPELVTEFAWLRRWTTVLESGDLEPAAHGGEYDRWSRHVREVTVALVREISQLCMVSGMTKHVDPTVPRPGFGRPSHAHMSGAPQPSRSWRRGAVEPQSRRGHGLG